jgi:putative iron-dependent peroxidase
MTAQPGIFALGTTDHLYVRGDLAPGTTVSDVVASVLRVVDDLSTTSGSNLVVGFRPELWPGLAERRPDDARGFETAVVGPDGFTHPATQCDVWLWFAAGSRSAAFDACAGVLRPLRDGLRVTQENEGWAYHTDRDLTGFIDGTENPSALAAVDIAAPAGQGSVLLVQTWMHDSDALDRMPVHAQELMIGRTKADSVELDDTQMPPSSHVSRTTVTGGAGEELKIFRRNTATGTPGRHGTNFIGFAADRARLQLMLERMAGLGDGVRDALTYVTTPVDGAYLYVPSVEELLALVPDLAP